MRETDSDLGRALGLGSATGVLIGFAATGVVGWLVADDAASRPGNGMAGLLFPMILVGAGPLGVVAGELTVLLSVAAVWLLRRGRVLRTSRRDALGAVFGAALGGALSAVGFALLGPLAPYVPVLLAFSAAAIAFAVCWGLRGHVPKRA